MQDSQYLKSGMTFVEAYARFPRYKVLIVPLKQIEYGVYGDLIILYPKPYSIHVSGTIRSCRNFSFDSRGAGAFGFRGFRSCRLGPEQSGLLLRNSI